MAQQNWVRQTASACSYTQHLCSSHPGFDEPQTQNIIIDININVIDRNEHKTHKWLSSTNRSSQFSILNFEVEETDFEVESWYLSQVPLTLGSSNRSPI